MVSDEDSSDDTTNFEDSDYDTWTRELLHQLDRLSGQLTRSSRLILFFTMLNFTLFSLIAALSTVSGRSFFDINIPAIRLIIILSQIALTFASLFLIFSFDSLRRRSGPLFESLSDTFQELNTAGVKAGLKLRFTVALRQFSASDTLPLVSTRQDVMIYAAFNMLILIFSIIVSSLSGGGYSSSY